MKLKIHHRLVNFLGLLILLNIAFAPPVGRKKYTLKAGEIAVFDVIAPYDFLIYKSPEELAAERAEIASRVPPIFESQPSVAKALGGKINALESFIDSTVVLGNRDSTLSRLQSDFGLPPDLGLYLVRNNYRSILKKLDRSIQDFYSRGIADTKPANFRIIAIRTGDKEIVETIDRLYTMAEAESVLTWNVTDGYRDLVRFFLLPNVIFNEAKTEDRVDEVFANVPKTTGEVLKGEIIVEKHRKVDQGVIDKLNALEKTYITLGSWDIIKTLILRNLFFLTVIFLIVNFNRVAKLNLFQTKNMYFVSLLFAIYLVMGRAAYETGTIYLLPVSFFVFLFALYFNFHTALFFSLVFAALFGVTYSSLSIFTYLLASGVAASFSSQTVRTRISLYRPLLYIALTNILAIFFINLYLAKGAFNLLDFGEGFLNSVLGSIAIGVFLPILERLFDFTTDLTLLELGNLNLPLFKEMSLKAPGTYHHSIVVGSLAEAGASAIGADPVLARVGAYYHDIGKLDKPEYFIENQLGVKNPHDQLKPQMSALVIISHIKEGAEMAKRMRLPKKLLDIIAEHHGTTTIDMFYRKALHQVPDSKPDDFSYPGPKPKTKEAALVMLADSVEAAARGERNINVGKLQKILKFNFDKKFNEGQLDECPVNRHDLEQIKTAFLPILNGIFHPRIENEETVPAG
jgi:putative nucleotidyltransferase with HDIG domain